MHEYVIALPRVPEQRLQCRTLTIFTATFVLEPLVKRDTVKLTCCVLVNATDADITKRSPVIPLLASIMPPPCDKLDSELLHAHVSSIILIYQLDTFIGCGCSQLDGWKGIPSTTG